MLFGYFFASDSLLNVVWATWLKVRYNSATNLAISSSNVDFTKFSNKFLYRFDVCRLERSFTFSIFLFDNFVSKFTTHHHSLFLQALSLHCAVSKLIFAKNFQIEDSMIIKIFWLIVIVHKLEITNEPVNALLKKSFVKKRKSLFSQRKISEIQIFSTRNTDIRI